MSGNAFSQVLVLCMLVQQAAPQSVVHEQEGLHGRVAHRAECVPPQAVQGRRVAVLLTGRLHYLGLCAENLRVNVLEAIGGAAGASVDVFVLGKSMI